MQTDEFVITDGTRFIRQNLEGKYKPTTNITMADTYPSRAAAINICKNCLGKALQRQYYVAQVRNGEIVQCSLSAPQKTKKKRTGLHFQSHTDSPEIDAWYDRVRGMENIFEDAQTRNDEMAQKLSDLEGTVQDILHFIEFSSLGASDGYKIYTLLRDALRKRRALKNEKQIINAINNNYGSKDAVNDILAVIKGLQQQSYEPRILKDLFTDGVKAVSVQKAS